MLPFELTKDTPYLALSGELWSVFYEYFNRNWSCYKGFLLHMYNVGLDIFDIYWYIQAHVFNTLGPGDTIWHHETCSTLVQVMVCCQFCTKPLPEQIILRPKVTHLNQIWFRIQTFPFKRMHLKLSSAKWFIFIMMFMKKYNWNLMYVFLQIKFFCKWIDLFLLFLQHTD